MSERWTDKDGAAWPITGRFCTECGMPLHRLLVDAGDTVHPLCDQAEAAAQ